MFPEAAENYFEKMINTNTEMMKQTVEAKLRGKGTPRPMLKEIRAVVPQTAVMGIADVVIATRLEDDIDKIHGKRDGIMSGGGRKTQVLDVAMGMSLCIEKGMDRRSAAVAAQMDIEAYYDKLPVVLVAELLLEKGADPAVVEAAVRHQMLCQININVKNTNRRMKTRSSGGLTGSRVGGQLARVPVEQMMRDNFEMLKRASFDCGEGRFVGPGSWVDNLYLLGASATTVAHTMTNIEQYLQTRWHLRINTAVEKSSPAKATPRSKTDSRPWSMTASSGQL